MPSTQIPLNTLSFDSLGDSTYWAAPEEASGEQDQDQDQEREGKTTAGAEEALSAGFQWGAHPLAMPRIHAPLQEAALEAVDN